MYSHLNSLNLTFVVLVPTCTTDRNKTRPFNATHGFRRACVCVSDDIFVSHRQYGHNVDLFTVIHTHWSPQRERKKRKKQQKKRHKRYTIKRKFENRVQNIVKRPEPFSVWADRNFGKFCGNLFLVWWNAARRRCKEILWCDARENGPRQIYTHIYFRSRSIAGVKRVLVCVCVLCVVKFCILKFFLHLFVLDALNWCVFGCFFHLLCAICGAAVERWLRENFHTKLLTHTVKFYIRQFTAATLIVQLTACNVNKMKFW